MKIFENPPIENWGEIVKRPVIDSRELSAAVASIIDEVRGNGDAALQRFSHQFQRIDLDDCLAGEDEFLEAEAAVADLLKHAIDVAKANIEKFHRVVEPPLRVVETTNGVHCWAKSLPIEKVGLYVPAGSAPLFSTVLMLAIPAKLAGCREIVMCSPPGADGKVNAATLYSARVCGV